MKKEETANTEVNEGKAPEKEQKNQKSEKAESKKESAKTKKALEEAEKALKEATEKQAELTDRYMRLAAEYDNFRKRSAKEKEDAYADAYIAAVTELLPVIDNLERAEEYAAEKEDTGSSLILKQLREALGKMSVEEIPAKDLPFDPNFHNAVMLEEGGDAPENTVTAVLQKGYTVRGKVIRFAMVKVAK